MSSIKSSAVKYRNVSTFNPGINKQKMDFKITPFMPKIFKHFVNRERLLVVEAPTGTGKTLGIPIALAEKNKKALIRVTVPTTISVNKAHDFIQRRTNITTGYAAGRVSKYSNTDQIVYMTTGYLVSRIYGLIKDEILSPGIGSGDVKTDKVKKEKLLIRRIFGDFLMIDEIHTASVWISALLGVMRYLFKPEGGAYTGPIMIMTSATVNTFDLEQHFPEAKTEAIDILSFPVERVFIDTVFDPLLMSANKINKEIIRIVELESRKKPTVTGLIFRPGKAEVEKTIEELGKAFRNRNVLIVPAYSGLTQEEMKNIDLKFRGLKLIVGTNFVESSVTIPDIDFVISDMLEKQLERSSGGGRKLSTVRISKASATQRIGRAGRTKPGIGYLLIDKNAYDELSPHKEREVDRVPIDNLVLTMTGSGLNIVDILKIDEKSYEISLQNLIDKKMIVKTQDGLEVTSIGLFVSEINLDIANSYIIYHILKDFSMNSALDFATARSAIALACMLETYGGGFFWTPRKTLGETQSEHLLRKKEFQDKSMQLYKTTDIATLINMFWQYSTFALRKTNAYLASVEWTGLYSVNNLRWREMTFLFTAINDIILELSEKYDSWSRLGGYIPTNDEQNIIIEKIAPVFRNAFANNKLKKINNNKYVNPKTGNIYRLDKHNAINTMKGDDKPHIIYPARNLQTHMGRISNFSSLYLPGSLEEMQEFITDDKPEINIPELKELKPVVEEIISDSEDEIKEDDLQFTDAELEGFLTDSDDDGLQFTAEGYLEEDSEDDSEDNILNE